MRHMFRGIVERTSHEGGLLLSFTGSSPALDSIIVREEDGQYIGKIDAVIGSTEAPLAHVAHLDKKQEQALFIGATVVVRPKKERDERPRRDQRNERPRRDQRNERTRHDSRSGNRRERPRQENHGRNDWECPACNNINFSFRTECNRCNKPKPGHVGGSDRSRGRFSERRDSHRRDSQPRNRDRGGRRNFGGDRGGRRNFGGDRGRNDDRRNSNRRQDDRDSQRRSGRNQRNQDRSDGQTNERYRKARGKRPGHAHNRGPRPIQPRRYQGKNRDD